MVALWRRGTVELGHADTLAVAAFFNAFAQIFPDLARLVDCLQHYIGSAGIHSANVN